MNNSHFNTANPLLDVVRLLEQIVVAFKDAYSRPETQIALYRRYEELRKRHKAKLAGPFIVIPGGKKRPSRRRLQPVTISRQQSLEAITKLSVVDSDLNTSSTR